MKDQISLGPDFDEMYADISQSRDEIEAKAKLRGCIAIFADSHTLQLDLDSPEAVEFFERQWRFLSVQSDFGAFLPVFSVSRNGNTHVTIRLTESKTAEERLMLQAVLGSDLKRELLNMTRLYKNKDDMTCLFVPAPKQLEAGSQIEIAPPDRGYSCGAAYCDDPCCNSHGAKDQDGGLIHWKEEL